jgi:hypothetical protein
MTTPNLGGAVFPQPCTGTGASVNGGGKAYKNLRYLLLKCQRMAATKTEFAFRKAA